MAAAASIRFSPDAPEWTLQWSDSADDVPRRMDRAGTMLGGTAFPSATDPLGGSPTGPVAGPASGPAADPPAPPLDAVLVPPSLLRRELWSSTNLCGPVGLPDLRVGEAVAIAAADSRFVSYGTAEADGVVHVEDRVDAHLTAIWTWLLGEFGSLPWDRVDIFAVEGLCPRGVSFPGIVCLDGETLRRSLTGRFLYLVHELIHQWFGNVVRFAPEDTGWESWIDALAWHTARTVLSPSVDGAFERLNVRYTRSDAPELVDRGLRTARYQRLLRNDTDAWAAWSRLAAAGAAALPTAGRRIRVGPDTAPAVHALLEL
ncbi:hypothetical protein PV392_09615 [Streptomyces sp. ME03-5709C]|nr:hypothetical protein [Streptomyces sp. ME03-5709C]